MEQAQHQPSQTCSIPDEVDFWLTYQSLYRSDWLAHLCLVFTVVLLARAFWFFDCPSRLFRLFRLLVTLATTSGRATRRRRLQLTEEVNEMRGRLQGLSMTDNFAVYSKLQRRIKAACGELDKASADSIPSRLVMTGGFRLTLLLLELVLQSWLVSCSPPAGLVGPSDLVERGSPACVTHWGQLVNSANRLLLLCLYWVPSRCYTLLLILLCRQWLAPRLLQLLTRLLLLLPSCPPPTVSDGPPLG